MVAIFLSLSTCDFTHSTYKKGVVAWGEPMGESVCGGQRSPRDHFCRKASLALGWDSCRRPGDHPTWWYELDLDEAVVRFLWVLDVNVSVS